MTSKKSVNEIIMKKLPEKGFIKNKGIDDTGLRKKPQMMQIVNYLENGQERMAYPDREATFVRNHPFMTQLDFLICKTTRKEHGLRSNAYRKQ